MSPSTANETDTFEHWLNRQFSAPLLNAEDRLRIASTFRRTELNTQDWLSTVELMREALILNSEQVTLCFSSLPRTKKNRALLDCFNFYLQSPLADDRMARIWNILGQLKSHAFTLSDELPLTFVPAEPSSYLFREFCNSIQYFPQNSKVDISSFDHLGLATSHGMSEVFSGNSIGAMESLCDALISNFHSCNKPVILHFFGKPQSLTWIKLRLAQAKLRFQVCWDTPTSYSPNFFTNLIASVRTTTHLPLIERLQIAHNLSQHPAYFGENQQDYFDRVLHSRAVSTEQIEFLQTLNPIELREPLTEFPQVLLFPLVNTPVLAGFDYFSFSDDSLLEPPTMHHLLSESELESLFYAGFQVPRWTETLQSRMAILKSHASRFHEKVFTSLKEEHLDGILTKPTPKKRTHSIPTSQDFSAQLPVTNLSATQLETFAECPSKYLFRRLKLKEAPIPLSKFALEFGQAVHLTLETHFTNEPPAPLTPENLETLFSQSLQTILPHLSADSSLLLFFKKAFEKTLPKILEAEANLKRVFGPTKTLGIEKEFRIEVEGIPLVGKIDRIDLLENNHLLVLDYKTGTVDFTPDHIAQGINFQALLYWLGAEQIFQLPLAAMLFYDLKKGELRRGLACESAISSDAKKSLTRGHTLNADKLDPLITSGKESLKRLAQSIKTGIFKPQPSTENCRFCEAATFCRQGAGYV